MWVYGDRNRRVRTDRLLAEAEGDWRRGDAISALIGLGQLLQGVADAEFEPRGCDARSPATDALAAALVSVARRDPDADRHLAALGPRLGTAELLVRVPEGYAFYALHPELHAAAARRLPAGNWCVVGIRSIGTSLAAVVAAALDAPPPVTVRPSGHPFARELSLSRELQDEWAAHTSRFVVVDEGPGLSGSSFGAVADALERLGVARDRIAFLPGHGGDLGPEASSEHRARWSGALRPVAAFDEVVLPRLQAGVEALTGPGLEPLRDISGGGWRALRLSDEPPPVYAGQERRKFLHRTGSGPWLVKFAGLGRIGAAKLERARALAAAGFTPEPAGLAEGFLVERWVDDAGALDGQPLERLAAYLDRRRRFEAESDDGAALEQLAEMIRVNAGEALGPAAEQAALRWAARAHELEPRVRRVHVDGRLHRWEWLARPGAPPLKTDAVDHSEAHDLVGAQDITWDIAGAELEFGLTPNETEGTFGADPKLLAFMRLAYPAFQLGLWTLAAQAQVDWAEEGARAQAQADRYARRLAARLDVDPPGPRV
jgi:hypothetical protein